MSNDTRDSDKAYAETFPAWEQLSRRAERVLAGGAIHDSQHLKPFAPYFERAQGPYKWGGGQRFVDYWMGHGALLLGHSFAPVVQAVARQLEQGSQFGGSHETVVRWAELICELIPSAERVRFAASGTEATLLAMRVARAFTGRRRILKFDGHFHGWHDEAMAYFVAPEVGGFNPGTVEHVALGDPDDVESVAEFLAEGEVAAVILEPGGGGSGALPWSSQFLAALREATRAHDTLLIFDEVVSGFRYNPGGVQALVGITPDVTVLGKIVCGGLPGAALAGRAEVMSVFGGGTRIGDRQVRVPHTGTFNANPLSAAAGLAMLEHVRDGAAQQAARRAASRLAARVNEAARAVGVDVQMYTHDASIFHISIGSHAPDAPKHTLAPVALFGRHAERHAILRRALLLEGVDCHPLHGWVSAAHDDAAIDFTATAFEAAFRRVRQEPGFQLPG